MNATDVRLLQAISELANCNPFSPRRFEIEKRILGGQCEPLDSIAWNRRSELYEGDRPNVLHLTQLASDVVSKINLNNAAGNVLPSELRQAYWDVATYLLLYRHLTKLPPTEIWDARPANQKRVAETWQAFWDDYRKIFDLDGAYPLDSKSAAHLFACLVQIHRAFFNIFDYILGESLPIARLREKVWESIFTCCLNRYHCGLFDRMRDLSTLVTGPSGTGKELVARAIGLSQYVPFDDRTLQFQFEPERSFLPLNLSALSPTLIESELFGHRKGAFTGAVMDRIGWLESCSPQGAVFLDEIGELDLGLQVKLLRVVQQRTYCRLGESEARTFAGKLIAATNRDLPTEIAAGRFREDFYFRLCTDRIETPSLRAQLNDRPGDLDWLVESMVNKHLRDGCEPMTDAICGWIRDELGEDYPWSGNIRELEQCVGSYLIRQEYVPMLLKSNDDTVAPIPWMCSSNRECSADELVRRYCTWLYLKYGSYEKTSRILKMDRRTVKAKVDSKLLAEWQAGTNS